MTIQNNSELWFLIADKVAEHDWKPLFSSLPLVNSCLRSGISAYLKSYVLPSLQKVARVDETLSVVGRCYQLHMELERPISCLKRHWQKHIHHTIKELLIDGTDQTKWQRLDDLLQARADVNAFTSYKSTPLLLVCDALGTIFSRRMSPEDRQARYTMIIRITEKLLQYGADPNLQGCPSTPLVTILNQQPFGSEDRVLMEALIKLLIAYGADKECIPFGSNKTPTELAKRWNLNI